MDTLPELPPYQNFVPKYLSYVPGRSIRAKYRGFKQHSGLGHAKSAIVNALIGYSYNRRTPHRMAIWEFNFSTHEWDLLYDIPAGTRDVDLPWRKEK
jgi:hypothetical protein